jgi:hypothetical protein
MADTRRLKIEVLGDAKGALTAFGSIDDGARKLGGKLADLGTKAAKAFAVVGTAAAGAAVVFGKQAVDAASDLAEATSKVGVIFGDSAGDVEAFAAQAATTMGQSKQEVLDAASTFATFGKAAGLAGDDLFGFSTDFVGLASDLASFNNTTPQEAVEAIGAALRGEAEPLRRYGVLLDDATLKQEALALGIWDGEGALSAAQKTRAAEIAIYKQTTDAQGDFLRTSDGLANSQRILRAQLANVTAQIGEQLLPIALKLTSFFADKIMPAVQAVADAFSENGLSGVFALFRNKISEDGPKAIDKATELLQSLGTWIMTTGLPWLGEKLGQLGQALVDWIGPRIDPALQKIRELLETLGAWFVETGLPWISEKLAELGQALIDWIGPRVGPALEAIGALIADVANWVIEDGLPLLREKLVTLGQALIDWVKPNIVPMLSALGDLLVSIADWIVTTAVPRLVSEAAKLGVAIIGWAIDIAPDLLKGLGTLLAKVATWVITDGVPTLLGFGVDLGKGLIDGIGDGLGRAFSAATSVAKDVVNAIIRFINTSIIDKVNDLVEFKISVPIGPDININPPDIPHIPALAKGGIVTGPTLALIGEAGPEAVVPLDRAGGMVGGGGINVTVNAGMGADGAQIGAQIVDYIRRYERSNGTNWRAA